jgi:aspartate/methionine/tyrosine aminotransferase
MNVEPFTLEKWLLNSAEFDLGGGVVKQVALKDITANLNYEEVMTYGDRRGSETLRKEVADWYPGVGPDNVLITSGTSEANLLVNLCLLEAGDQYVVEYPLYDQPPRFARSLGCEVLKFHLKEHDWKPDLERLNQIVTKKSKIIFFDNPNNPTGALLTEQEMRSICEIANDANAYVVCDNALRGSELDGKLGLTPFGLYDKAVVTGSISKLGMIGPRIGWIIGNPDVIDKCCKFKDYTTLCHSGMSEHLATIVMRRENRTKHIDRNLKLSKATLPVLMRWIRVNSSILTCVTPKAGFTAFPRCNLSIGSEEFCKMALKEERVLLSPGEYFGVDNHFRINFGCESTLMTKALTRLERLIGRYGK